MEYRHLAYFLDLDKRTKYSALQIRLTKSLPKVFTVFKEVQKASIHIKQYAYNRARLDAVVLDLRFPSLSLGLCLPLHIIIFTPLFVRENVSRLEIDAPHIFLPTQVLIHKEILPAYPNTNFGVKFC